MAPRRSMIRTSSAKIAIGSVVTALVVTGCTVGGDDEAATPSVSTPQPSATSTGGPRPSSTAQPPGAPPSQGPVTPPDPSGEPATELDELLEAGGLTSDDIGYPPRADAVTGYGMSAPTQDQCDAPDATDARRLGRVQQYWASEGWTTGADPAIALSVELVAYDEGGGAAALASFAQKPTECPTRELADGGVVTFSGTDVPRGALPDSAALRGQVAYPDGTAIEQMIVAQRVGDLVGYLYVVGFDATVATDGARVATMLATALTELAPAVEDELGD